MLSLADVVVQYTESVNHLDESGVYQQQTREVANDNKVSAAVRTSTDFMVSPTSSPIRLRRLSLEPESEQLSTFLADLSCLF